MSLSPRAARLWVASIVVVSLAACLWGAAADLHSGREYDESHSMRNLRSILETGSLRPEFEHYPALAYLPQTALVAAVRAVGPEERLLLEVRGDTAPWIYLLSRWMCTLFAAGALVLTYFVGRRWFSVPVALVAVLLLAGSPFFIRAATMFKPDALQMLLALAVLLWSLDAAERGTLGPYLLAGAGIGLAAAAKQNGALVFLPLPAAAAFDLRRQWLRLAAAALASVAVFVLLNPFPDLLLEYPRISVAYREWAEAQPSLPPALLYLPWLFAAWHGPVIGAVVLLGLAGLVVRLVRRRRDRVEAVRLALFLSLPIGFPLACLVVSSYPKQNIFLPIMPSGALAAAWLLVTAWDRVAARWPAARRGPATALALAALVAVVLPPAARYVYWRAVPETTADEVATWLASGGRSLRHRTVVFEGAEEEFLVERRRTRSVGERARVMAPRSLVAMPVERLELADYEIFPEARLEGAEKAFYVERVESVPPAGRGTVRPRPLRTRGEALQVVLHPWRLLAPVEPLTWKRGRNEDGQRVLESIVRARRSPVISLDLLLTERQAEECTLRVGEERLELFRYAWQAEQAQWMTPRLVLPRNRLVVRFECPRARRLRPAPSVSVWRWAASRPAPGLPARN